MTAAEIVARIAEIVERADTYHRLTVSYSDLCANAHGEIRELERQAAEATEGEL